MLQELQSSLNTNAKVTGLKQSQRAVTEDRARHAFIANDAEKRVTSAFRALCAAHGVEITEVETMRELGAACGIEVGAAVAVLLK